MIAVLPGFAPTQSAIVLPDESIMNHLPTILCIHGQGTNGTIFRLQARRIVQALQKSFNFVFVDAPFESLPGPGVVPVFSDLAPFLRWHCDGNTLDKFDITVEELDEERRAARKLLAGHVEKVNWAAATTIGAGVVGIMAFSQGTRVATGLMLDADLGRNIKFAILICGTFPVLGIADQAPAKVPVGVASREVGRLTIPSIHLQGSYDPWQAEGIRLKETYYDSKLVSTVKFSGGHQVPAGVKEADQVASWVLSEWQRRNGHTA